MAVVRASHSYVTRTQVPYAGHGAEAESRQEKEGRGRASQVLAPDLPCEEINTVIWWRGAAVNC